MMDVRSLGNFESVCWSYLGGELVNSHNRGVNPLLQLRARKGY